MEHLHLTAHAKEQCARFSAIVGFVLVLFGMHVGLSYGEPAYYRSLQIASEIPVMEIQIQDLQEDLRRMDRMQRAQGDTRPSETTQLRDDERKKDKVRDLRVRLSQLDTKLDLQWYYFVMYKALLALAATMIFVGCVMVLKSGLVWLHAQRHWRRAHATKKK